MKKRIGQPERRRLECDEIKTKLKLLEYDENKYLDALWDVVEHADANDDSVLTAVVPPEYASPTFFARQERLDEITDDEKEVVWRLAIGFIFFFVELGDFAPLDRLWLIAGIVEKGYGFEDGSVLRTLRSISEKGFELRFVVPVPTGIHEELMRMSEREAS